MGREAVEKKSNRKFILKIISFGVSFLIWFYVLNSEFVKFQKKVKVEYIVPSHLVLVQHSPLEVTLIIDGPRALMRSLEEREEKIVVDLRKPPYEGQMRPLVAFHHFKIDLPYRAKFERAIPEDVLLRLEPKQVKEIPVKLMFEGELPKGVELEVKDIRPKNIQTTGPQSVLSLMNEIKLRPVHYNSLFGQSEMEVNLDVKFDQFLEVSSGERVIFSYDFKGITPNVRLEKIPVNFLTTRKIKTDISSVTVEAYAPETIFKEADRRNIKAQVWADIDESSFGESTVELRAIVPNSVQLIKITPSSIKVDVQ